MLRRKMRCIVLVLLALSFVIGLLPRVQAQDINEFLIIKSRLKEYFINLDTIDDGSKVEACYVSHGEDYLSLIEDDGSFADVDYEATNNAANGAAWSPYLALDRMQAIAIAYHKEGNALYQDPEVPGKLSKAIEYWGIKNPRSTNWWENQVGVQLRFSRIALFMEGLLTEDAQDILLTKLKEKTPVKYGTGQNNLWFDQNYVYHAIITEDEAELLDMVHNYLDYCLSTQLDDTTSEAVQVDNSFYMHGRQFYSNGYGMSMFRDMSFWIYILRGTRFAVSNDVITRMGNYMINGTSWTVRGDIMELYLGYRPYKHEVGYANYAKEYVEPLKRMIESDPVRAADYQAILNNIENPESFNGKNGHYYMWRSGYDSHMREGYGVNIKMDSKNLKGGEWRGPWNEPNKTNQQLIFWTSTASSAITVDGDEYTSVYPVFDWTRVPGATSTSYISGKFDFENSELFDIGVNNGTYGATAYKFNKSYTSGLKGYFFFDDEFVALGNSIKSTATSNICTTLNQAKAENVVVSGQNVPFGTEDVEFTAKYVYNNKIGYVFPEETAVRVSNRAQKDMPSLWPDNMKDAAANVFTAYVEHGVKPTDGSYAYIVVPNKTQEQVAEYAENIPVVIVSNTPEVQAVRHDGLKITEINFYKSGSLEYKPGYVVKVDAPCSLIIDETDETRKISLAVNDHESNKEVNVKITHGEDTTNTCFISGDLPYAGQPMTRFEGQTDKRKASSEAAGREIDKLSDAKAETYWESAGNGEEYILLYQDPNAFLQKMTINWGDNYATDYDVYLSEDGSSFVKCKEVTDGHGRRESIELSAMCKCIKIVLKSSSGDSYQIKELSIKESSIISLNKTTYTSSVSTQAPTFVGGLAVDGDLATRWASLRNSDEEWITIDLGENSCIDAVKVYWEAGASSRYAIEVSDDNDTFAPVRSELSADQELINTIILPERPTGRYVKINSSLTKKVSGKNYGISTYEVSVYGEYVKDIQPEEPDEPEQPTEASQPAQPSQPTEPDRQDYSGLPVLTPTPSEQVEPEKAGESEKQIEPEKVIEPEKTPAAEKTASKTTTVKTNIKNKVTASEKKNGFFYKADGTKVTNAIVNTPKGDSFILNKKGEKFKDTIVKIKNGSMYIAGKNGALIKGKITKVGNAEYYTTKGTGKVVVNKMITYKSKKYVALESGKLAKSQWVTLEDGKMVYCDKKGVVTKTKKAKTQ